MDTRQTVETDEKGQQAIENAIRRAVDAVIGKRKEQRERRKTEFARVLFEYVSAFAQGPTHGDVDQWQMRLTELGEQLFDQAGP